ncbi:MAG: hypothetical protein HKN81_08345 [Gammaproteobacteria bacterium]|nr:hypothetical protein [Gammaproteobacteria bacterium]
MSIKIYHNPRCPKSRQTVQWLSEHPKVLQRPIVISGDEARIGRPPESVLNILS